MKIKYSEIAHNGQSKKDRYGWSDPGSQGEMKHIEKSQLEIPKEYQRDLSETKVTELTKLFMFAAFGVLTVVQRACGMFVVADGQHRLYAALRRSDVRLIPCIVFKVSSLEEEAQIFLAINTGRRALTAIEKLKAEEISKDPVSELVVKEIEKNGLEIKKAVSHAGQIKCVAACKKVAEQDPRSFPLIIKMAADLSFAAKIPVPADLIMGLHYLHKNIDGGIVEPRLHARIRTVGAALILEEVARFLRVMKGGEKTIGDAMLSAINKGLRTKFELKGGKK